MTEQTETLADRLNQEPVIFRGSTNSELGMILICAVAFWLPVSFLIGALLGAVMMGLGISAMGILATVLFGSTVFQRIKRGRPDYYYQQKLLIFLTKNRPEKYRVSTGFLCPEHRPAFYCTA